MAGILLQKHCSRDLLHKDNIDGRCTIFNNNPEYADTDFALVFAGADNQHGRRSFNQYFSGSNTDSGIHAYFCTEDYCRRNHDDYTYAVDVERVNIKNGRNVRLYDGYNSLKSG